MAKDWSPARIRYQLNELGLTLRDVDRRYSLKTNVSASASKKPHATGEKALAETLGKSPREIWPSRYRITGERLRPQPKANYSPVAVYRHRQKRKAA